MKKFFFFAFALVAGALAFNSCDNGNDPEDAVVFNATGELRGVMFPVFNEHQQAVITLHPKANTVDVKFVQARIASESETPQDIYIHNMKLNAGEVHISLVLADGSPYKPFPKSFAHAEMDQKQTTFNMHFGNDDERDTQVYLVFNTMLQPEDPKTPDINPADYAGTKWRVDSCMENGVPVHGPHFFIDVKTDKEVILNGDDTTTFAINGDVMTVHAESAEPWEVKILKATKDYAELHASLGTLYLSRIPDMEGAKLTPSKQNIVGKWKWDWYYTEIYHWVYDWQRWATDYTIGTTAGVETWEFREDGALVQINTMDARWQTEPRVYWWAFNEVTKQIAWGYNETRPDTIPDNAWMSVELTDHVMHFRKYEPSQNDEGYQDHRWYFSR